MACHLLYVDFLSTYSYNVCGVIYMDIIRVFGANVRRYRERAGMSQERLAEISELHRTYISDVERFQRSISLTNIQKIADALGINAFMLLKEDDTDELQSEQ